MAESEEELKSLLMRVKEESGKTDLKLNTQNTKIMASSPMTSWPIEGEKVAAVTDFYFPGLQNHDGCSHDVKRRLLLGREAMTNLNSVLKKQRYHFAEKVYIVKAVVFPLVMCELDHKEG